MSITNVVYSDLVARATKLEVRNAELVNALTSLEAEFTELARAIKPLNNSDALQAARAALALVRS